MSRSTPLPRLVDPGTLETLLEDPRLVVVDLSETDAYRRGHVPGAVALDYDAIVGEDAPRAGLLPDRQAFGERMARLGIGRDSRVVAYDDSAGLKAGRLLWTLDAFGLHDWALLDGGMGAWQAAGAERETAPADPEPATRPLAFTGEGVATAEDIRAELDDPDLVILDTRSEAEYRGFDRRSRHGGHIPGALHYDWTALLDPADPRHLRPLESIRADLAALGVTGERRLVAYCQSHRRSSLVYVVLRALGFESVRGYPGAWSDWGNRDDTPIET